MICKNTNKILVFLIVVAVLMPGIGALDNVTVIESYPDGQPKHITYTLPLVYENSAGVHDGKILKPSWTCPPDEIPMPTETSIGGELPERCKVMPKPDDYIYDERVDRWLNPYGQTISIPTSNPFLQSELRTKKR